MHRIIRASFGALLVLALAGGAAAACGGGRGDYCDAKCECEGCSAAGYDACLADYDSEYRSADLNGCLDYYDALLDCESATAVCVGARFETSCKVEHDRWKNCMDPGKKR